MRVKHLHQKREEERSYENKKTDALHVRCGFILKYIHNGIIDWQVVMLISHTRCSPYLHMHEGNYYKVLGIYFMAMIGTEKLK